MDRRSAAVLLAVFGAGVFLAGLELMVTAVALPSILSSLADPASPSAWIELRKASWIINGYLLVYILTMPLAGRLTDLWGARRLLLGALLVFALGSALAGIAQDLDQLIAARVIQALGGGVLVPVGTAAAAHLFEGPARPRALGITSALTFLGMAAGPFVGAAILGSVHAEGLVERAGLATGWLHVLTPAWRWVFLANVPLALVALLLGWAASSGWDTPRRRGRVDLPGAAAFGLALLAALLGLTLIGTTAIAGTTLDPSVVTGGLLVVASAATVVAVARGLRTNDPFLDPRLFAIRAFSGATVVSLLTGYAFATAIIGAAVFVDRVLYGGPDEQRLALGALAGATAIGALLAGFAVRVLSLRLVTFIGLALSIGGLIAMATWTPTTSIGVVAGTLATFGFGFGLTVTPRSTAAVEAVGLRSFGMASSIVTVARMVGMAVGLAILTAYGSTTIDHLSQQIYATPDAYQQLIPASLHGRAFDDPLVVDALEAWASREAARIMVGLFLVAAAVTALAIPPALVLGGRPRMLARDAADLDAVTLAGASDLDGRQPTGPGIAL